ncbi:nucleolar protein 16 [Cryptococcus deuterogattii 99/473]|uniref:Nucleolar protein 16 n=2 Tax=Cryptococcus deuterogattii TaxID=1859096 RepID=A0A0D0U4R5_9TREE|nr:nucleolar protein 16 [Cryptococcus deuterogattii R265]KIR30626.1 nucleolar protein 16 [Cryptococcus deuterogattii LA55]KIR43183.1 nucleolar protein 16 [Cryptococcus deuterogattii Ram5]KIR69777.1 nucleolar protein 16 [Cryptococcus deuterogattii CA1014]KIR92557.1 nucleolar protein 16 [Cryptococcus deuterogattii CBS 10090]KIS01723.1 nucleolar protein 16 [Cryptococcus deuterogattii 2001/935-1]KIY56999.1 nucleolar protein 16 [Cryptococcus deuterogattii 99/473]
MANPRQRNKAKSSRSHKPSLNAKRRMHQKLRKAPPLKGPEVLQEKWDKKKTVFQNYAALGLLPSIPVPKGASTSRSQRVKLPEVPAEVEAENVKVGFGRIIRDEEGNVIDIIIDEDEQEQEEQIKVHEEKEIGLIEAKTEVVKRLEELAASAAPVKRHSSMSERTWLQQLVDKYGDDTEKMARDRKLNVWQKTEGEIKRMIKKAGGVQLLRK